jgi:cation diffusion facilitator CzcD-associated flavoprotein CzcO
LTAAGEPRWPHVVDVAVIGGGQSALAVGYYLRRTGLRFTLIDDQRAPGGAWQQTWPSLRLFSPAQWSSLPGWLMPRDHTAADDYPTRDRTIAYLREYESRYALPTVRPFHVDAVRRQGDRFLVEAGSESLTARAIVSATGTWANPHLPSLPGQSTFTGTVIHSAQYRGPSEFVGRRVVVVGGGNSAAQIVAELSTHADVTWATLTPPTFLPDEIDGRYLFEQATARHRAIQEGRTPEPPRSLGDIVAVPSVREARARGVLHAVPMFERFSSSGVVWADGREERIDALIFATGFRPALSHLEPLGVVEPNGRVEIRAEGSRARSAKVSGLWLVGYGEWTGFASATLIGVGRSARAVVDEIVHDYLP